MSHVSIEAMARDCHVSHACCFMHCKQWVQLTWHFETVASAHTGCIPSSWEKDVAIQWDFLHTQFSQQSIIIMQIGGRGIHKHNFEQLDL